MNTFETICQLVGVLLLVAAIACILVVACNKPVRWLSIILLVLVFTVSGCNGHFCMGHDCDVYKEHDTGTYYRYRAVNLRTGRIQIAKIDTVWNVYQPTDTVFLDKMGFIAATRDKIVDTVELGICTGAVTLQDDTLILKSSKLTPEDLGTAD